MIDAKYLRIGNIFKEKYSIKPIKVLELLRNDVIVFDYETSEKWQAEPIPLTEKILLQCGFEKDEDYFQNGIFHYRTTDNAFFIGNDHVSGGNIDCIIDYLHHLQNIYSALTKQELPINIETLEI